MKRFLILLKLEYDSIFIPLCMIITIMASLQLILIGHRLRYIDGHISLALLVDAGNIPIVFAIAFICLLALIAARLAANFTPSKSMYALLTLPIKRRHVYLAKLTASFIAGFMLLAAQMVLLLVFNALAGSGRHNESSELMWMMVLLRNTPGAVEFEMARRYGDLYLSLLDSFFLRTLFPPDLFSLAFSLLAFFGSISVMLYTAVIFISGKRSGVSRAVIWLAFLLLTFPLADYAHTFNLIKLVFLIIITYASVIKGSRLFEKGEVTG